MKPDKLYRFNFPILRWLFVLLLATGISDFGVISQQTYQVETVGFSLTNSSRETRIVKYSTVPKKSLFSKSEACYLKAIKLLSFRLSDSVEVTLKRQLACIQSFPKNTIRQYLIRNWVFTFPEYFSDFIS